LILTCLVGFVDGADSGEIVGAALEGSLGAVGGRFSVGLADGVGGVVLGGETFGGEAGVVLGAAVAGLLDGTGFSAAVAWLSDDETAQSAIEMAAVNAAIANSRANQSRSADLPRFVWNPRDRYGSSLALSE
jgi:hypothetical protein